MIFIYVSGIDGCGKTTQAQLLVKRLNECGRSAEYCWLRWEPTLPIIRVARRFLNRNRHVVAKTSESQAGTENLQHARWRRMKRRLLSFSLFRQLWLAHATRDYGMAYRKASAAWKSEFVVLDRYVFDFIVDQALNLDVSPARFSAALPDWFRTQVPMSHIAVIIDIPAEVGYARKRDGTSLAYLNERERLYAEFSAAGQVLHVDGTRPQEAIHQDIFTWIDRQYGISI